MIGRPFDRERDNPGSPEQPAYNAGFGPPPTGFSGRSAGPASGPPPLHDKAWSHTGASGVGPAFGRRGSERLPQGSSLNRQVPFGRTTERFFVEGDEHEARQWQDTILPPDDEPEPRRWRGRIDRVPRQKGAMFALALFAVCLVAGIAVGVSAVFKTGNSVSAAVAKVKSWLPLSMSVEPSREVPVGTSAVQPPQPLPPTEPLAAAPAAGQATQSPMPGQPMIPAQPPAMPPGERPPVGLPSAIPPAPGPVPVPAIVPARPPVTAPATPKSEKDKEAAEPTPASTSEPAAVSTNKSASPSDAKSAQLAKQNRRHGQREKDNYVWSPELNALVPASSMSEEEQPTSRFDSGSQRSAQSAVTRTLRQLPNPFQKDELSPPPLPNKSSIAPATTGAPNRERLAPPGSDPFER